MNVACAHSTTASLNKDDKIPCKLCGSEIKLKSMRNHVGGHLPKALRGIDDSKLQSKQVCSSVYQY